MRLLIVANREPLREENGDWLPSVGGLTTALLPVLEERGGVWVAWGEKQAKEIPHISYPKDNPRLEVARLHLSKSEVANYYYGLANRVLWPLCHYFNEQMTLRQEFYRDYQRVNHRFANKAADVYEEGDLAWVQDYQLMLVPQYLRKAKPASRIGFFFHIPWPALEVWRVLPWAQEFTESLLGADLIGFHTEKYAQNFLEAALSLTDAEVHGNKVLWQGREIRVEAHPIGIDTGYFKELAERPEVRREMKRLRKEIQNGAMLLGVDRLDYTKGVLERLLAFECFLQANPDAHGKVTLYQVATPSRTRVESYRQLKRSVDEAVGRINGSFMQASWVPVRYLYHSYTQEELAAFYLAADAALITPLRDGMNLVAQEFAMTSERGALILSELTGAANLLPEALIVNPYDIEGIAKTIKTALAMPEEERKERLAKLKERVVALDVHRWAEGFLTSLEGA
ncbi:MAG: trehalose-6-phosphate synthase [Deinococcota bacterium]|nr:trehalose-6-phosphate synthase [Deinococcota bacterium]